MWNFCLVVLYLKLFLKLSVDFLDHSFNFFSVNTFSFCKNVPNYSYRTLKDDNRPVVFYLKVFSVFLTVFRIYPIYLSNFLFTTMAYSWCKVYPIFLYHYECSWLVYHIFCREKVVILSMLNKKRLLLFLCQIFIVKHLIHSSDFTAK